MRPLLQRWTFGACCLLLACGPAPRPPREFRAGASCMFQGSAFGAVTVGNEVVVSLFELDALQQLRLSDCSERKRWDVAAGPRALTPVGAGLATAAANALTLSSPTGSSTSLPTTPAPLALVAADLDADGTPELIATLGATAAEAKVLVLRTANGTLSPRQELPLTAAAALTSVDLDADSDLDILVARTTEHRLTVLTNVAGVLTVGPDIPVCDEPFALTTLPNPPAAPTIVVTCRTGGLELLRQVNGAIVRQKLARTGTLYETAVADFDLDGRPDFASVDPFAHRLVFWWGKASGEQEAPVEVATGLGPILLRAFDFDTDARPELLVLAFQDRSVTVFRHEETSR